MRTRWFMNSAGACLGEGRGNFGCVTLWRQAALRRCGGGRAFGGRQATLKRLRVPRASSPFICVKTFSCFCNSPNILFRMRGCEVLRRAAVAAFHQRGQQICGGSHECLDPRYGRALGPARPRKERDGRPTPVRAGVAARTARDAAMGGPENVIWFV